MKTSAPFSQSISDAQRRAIFAAARQRGLDTDAIREMTPAGSISMLTSAQAHDLLDQLNKGTPHERTGPPQTATGRAGSASRRAGRKPEGVIRFVSAEQKALIASIRMELGWPEAGLAEWLSKRHYRYDPSRSMDKMDSTADAAAVIELLKAVRARTFTAGTRPHKRQIWTITDRLTRIARARNWTMPAAKEWARTLKLRDGREAHAMCTTADASEVIEMLTRELTKEGA